MRMRECVWAEAMMMVFFVPGIMHSLWATIVNKVKEREGERGEERLCEEKEQRQEDAFKDGESKKKATDRFGEKGKNVPK